MSNKVPISASFQYSLHPCAFFTCSHGARTVFTNAQNAAGTKSEPGESGQGVYTILVQRDSYRSQVVPGLLHGSDTKLERIGGPKAVRPNIAGSVITKCLSMHWGVFTVQNGSGLGT